LWIEQAFRDGPYAEKCADELLNRSARTQAVAMRMVADACQTLLSETPEPAGKER
jgi:hypothetical protein